jgi:hypothetical protein
MAWGSKVKMMVSMYVGQTSTRRAISASMAFTNSMMVSEKNDERVLFLQFQGT